VTRPSKPNPRLAFLSRVVGKQCRHLLATDQRLFDQPFSAARAGQLEANPDLAGASRPSSAASVACRTSP